MKIKTLKRIMIDRTIAQKHEVVDVTAKEGKALIDKGHAVEVDKPEAKTDKTKAKADTKDKAD